MELVNLNGTIAIHAEGHHLGRNSFGPSCRQKGNDPKYSGGEIIPGCVIIFHNYFWNYQRNKPAIIKELS